MRDPLRIPGVLDELRASWEALPDVTLPELWGLLEARGVALNSSDAEVVDALRAVRARHPSSFSFSSSLFDANLSPSPVLVETEGPDQRVTLVPRAVRGLGGEPAGSEGASPEQDAHGSGASEGRVQLWAVVRGAGRAQSVVSRRARSARGSRAARGARRNAQRGAQWGGEQSTQPGLWRVAEVKRCRAGEPLLLIDESEVQHRLGVVRRLTVLTAEDDPRPQLGSAEPGSVRGVDLSGVRREELEGRVFVARLAEGAGTVVIGTGLECFLAERRELKTSAVRWERLVAACEGEELQVTGLDGQVRAFGVVETLLQAE